MVCPFWIGDSFIQTRHRSFNTKMKLQMLGSVVIGSSNYKNRFRCLVWRGPSNIMELNCSETLASVFPGQYGICPQIFQGFLLSGVTLAKEKYRVIRIWIFTQFTIDWFSWILDPVWAWYTCDKICLTPLSQARGKRWNFMKLYEIRIHSRGKF